MAAARNPINVEPTTLLTCPAARCPLPSWSRTFSSTDALLEHARQTRAQHPLCTTCLRVFKDTAALEQVRGRNCSSVRPSLNQVTARRSKTRRRMPTLQPKIQVTVRHRPALALLECPSQLSRLRGRSCGHDCTCRGEEPTACPTDLLRTPSVWLAHRQCPSESTLLRRASERERPGRALPYVAQPPHVQRV